MASVATIARVSAILLLCLALRGCDGKFPFNAAEALAKARAAAVGNVGPDVKHFNVLDYGAKADGKTDSSINFIRAFKAACNYNGNAMMVIPDGNFLIGPVIFSGPCFNPSPLIIQANGMVKAQSDISYYAGGADDTDWITLQSIDGLILTGHGTFHGQGAEVWKYNNCGKKSNCVRLPATIDFINVSCATISNITLSNSKGFHLGLHGSNNINIHNLNITAPGDSPNTDGIHVSHSSNIKISSSTIGVGDDCVSIGPGSSNISISNVHCGPGHGISVGSLGKYKNEKDVVGINVRNCTIKGTQNGIRVKTWLGAPASSASNMTFEDVFMINVSNPIIIDQEYCPSNTCNTTQPSLVKLTDIFIRNVNGTYNTNSAVTLLCSTEVPCENVQLVNISLNYVVPDSPRQGRLSMKGFLHGLQVINSRF
ncbi:hypothetical protein POUND7_018821 [Theobroma cacao]